MADTHPSLRASKHQSANAHTGYRLGTTSFILADDYLNNIRFLADKVEDIALLFFESITPETDLSWLADAVRIQAEANLSVTVHLPADVQLASKQAAIREAAVQACADVIQALAPLTPRAYVCHGDGDDGAPPDIDALTHSLRELGEICGAPERICIENTHTPHAELAPAIDASGASICYDIGHALQHEQDVAAELARWLPRCGVFHMHGVQHGKDHHSTRYLPDTLFDEALQAYAHTGPEWRVLTLELFRRDRWEDSLQHLRERLKSQ
ncbi:MULTISPECIES: cobamide remodeling phosphodiesterase CbiR [unclassified Lentimonas]|uniref:cobamide remodeling phosphodiesterase CbiR n=1 Tax=unclassified Lentimonas TaxID=2630993 RepID=UPI00132BAF72|nr:MULTISPECIES: cobamide remodeling phosphodiesterase CbiR [unclassified Lentimonas]CAA6691588.1 Unannotated [Lentimonas sp. CC10]CAA6696258.1 Unannotated [Lentimonas sp. CC19]CAA7070859.1 Unannotated [Lentimonas sp. CC11]